MFEIREGGSRGLGGGKGHKRVGLGLTVCLSACLSVCLSCLSDYMPVCPSACLSLAAGERDRARERDRERVKDRGRGGGGGGNNILFFQIIFVSHDAFIFITHIRKKFYFLQPLFV